MVRPVQGLHTAARINFVNRESIKVCQNVMNVFKADYHVQQKLISNDICCSSREHSQALSLALTVHHNTRSKALVELLNPQLC